MRLTCIIVEDELLSRKSILRLCEQHNSLDVLAVFDNAVSAVDYLSKREVDLIWLDIEMPGPTGFDLLDQVPAIPYVILTSGKTEYAYDAFRYQVTDYLKKPIALARFNAVVEKVLNLHNMAKAKTGSARQEIYIKIDGRYIRLPFGTISYLENAGDYVKIVTSTQTHIVYATMKCLEEKLGDTFMRVHRSFIVNLEKIVDIEENTLVISDKVIPISRANRPELIKRLNLV